MVLSVDSPSQYSPGNSTITVLILGHYKEGFILLYQNRKFFAIEITDKMLSRSKFWSYVVNVKIVKIRHLNGHINYVYQNKNFFFCKKKHHNVVPLIFCSLLGHLYFLCIFSSLSWKSIFFFSISLSYLQTRPCLLHYDYILFNTNFASCLAKR